MSSAKHVEKMRTSEVNRSSSFKTQALYRHYRLVRSSQFREAYAQNNRVSGKFMTLWKYCAADSCSRIGVVASKKVGIAVSRNRAKRRMREIFRLHRNELGKSFDIVLVARRAILKAKWREVEDEFLSLVKKAGLFRQEEENKIIEEQIL